MSIAIARKFGFVFALVLNTMLFSVTAGAAEWKRHVVHEGAQSLTAIAGDFTKDGQPDIIASGTTTAAATSLDGFVEQMQQAEAVGDWETVGNVDLEFHVALVDATSSPRLKRMFSTVISETRLCLGVLTAADARSDLVEAIALSDTVHVLGQGPRARIRARYKVTIPRPRKLIEARKHPEFGPLLDRLWRDLEDVSASEAV